MIHIIILQFTGAPRYNNPQSLIWSIFSEVIDQQQWIKWQKGQRC